MSDLVDREIKVHENESLKCSSEKWKIASNEKCNNFILLLKINPYGIKLSITLVLRRKNLRYTDKLIRISEKFL